MNNILLLGEKGYLGSFLYENLKVDVLEDRTIYNNGKQYKYIINCIGKPDLEYCEQNKEETDYSNRDVIDDIQKYYPSSKIINFSSYYVYNDEGLCNESSNVTYEYNYTRQKLEAENKIINGVTFRIGKLFGHLQTDKQNKLTEHIIKNNNLTLDTINFNPTSLYQVHRVVEYELKTGNLNGIFNLANDGITTHYEYGVFIDNFLKSNKNITKTYDGTRKFNNYGKFIMSCNKLKQYVSLVSWKEDMINYLEKWLHKS